MRPERATAILKLLLRLIGGSSLFAIIFVAAPESWMVAIHTELGLGQLPDAPIVGYLARSTSAFYAIIGGLFLAISFDLVRYRPIARYLGAAMAVFGAVLVVVDTLEGLPLSWTLWEGPFVCLFGLAVLWLSSRIQE
jgi:drug/metabolite transporter superfamily protein YnfA